jgi:phosphate starvation-inducible PhoH-like protein
MHTGLVAFPAIETKSRQSPAISPTANQVQKEALQALEATRTMGNRAGLVVMATGLGKTWLAATYAADLYRLKTVNKIILTRPNVPCGRSLGFFPGSMEKKFAPWAVPVTDAIRDRLGEAVYDLAIKNGDIEVVPFEVMRGRTWKEAFVLLDEAQNTSITEMKMFLTRIGENCLTVINGDVAQCDLEKESGLRMAIDLVGRQDLPVPVVEFSIDDVVRSGICAMWVRAFAESERPALFARA